MGTRQRSRMSSELEGITLLDLEADVPAACDLDAEIASPAHASTMLSAMEPRDDDVPPTQPADVSLSDPTQTSEPVARTAPGAGSASEANLPPLPTQVRDHRRYHFLGEHGRGGLGRVSRAHDRELGRDIAIKELLSRTNANEVRFLREVLITARLEHPGIVPVHEAGRWDDGTPFYAMKLVAGRSLRDLIAERTEAESRIGLLHHVIAVADAIAYAHGRNIIHRDLKPANVIVGDFGETVVIDWGLAKDLSSAEISAVTSGPFHTGISADDLTSTGSVVGTPAYMAPEQRRGEPVDQRADVFAIGVMLWELCAPERVPPAQLPLRHRMLRHAGIDEDLAAIIEKALDPEPERRYPHAGALAADLKAFKSGARIAARSYSLPAMLAHWTRRHRALALSLAVAVALAVTVGSLYVRNIAIERDRADTSEAAARRAQAAAEAARDGAEKSRDEAMLKNAELFLTTDPSAALDVLAAYHGAETDRANQIRAKAIGLGVALVRAVPHTGNVTWTQGGPDGAILSLSLDGTLVRTARDGRWTVLARDASTSGVSAYAGRRHLLAYACNPSDLCLYDALAGARVPTSPMLRDASALGLAFSPDGNLLAVMSRAGVLTVLDVADPAHPASRLVRRFASPVHVRFLGNDALVTGDATGIEFLRLTGETERYASSNTWRWAVSTDDRAVALAGMSGHAVVLASFPVKETARAELCRGQVADMAFVPGRHSIAYACRTGEVGLWDLQRGAVQPRAQLEGHADLIAASPTGDHVIVAGGNGTVTVLDLRTELIASYKGHGFRLTSIAPPTPEQPFLTSGDVRGGIRAWSPPSSLVRVAATSSSPFHNALFRGGSATVIATTWLPELTMLTPGSDVRTVQPHQSDGIFLERSGSGATFAAYGLHDDAVEIWSAADMTRTSVLHTQHGSISHLHFANGSDDVITAGRDGKLVRWTAGQRTEIARADQPIDVFAMAAENGPVVYATADGALWHTTGDRAVSLSSGGGGRVNRLVAFPDHTIYAGYASGDVVAIDTRSWRQDAVLHGPDPVREIAVARDGRTIAVATNSETIHVGQRDPNAPDLAFRWQALKLRARHVSLTPDGVLVASCTDGTIWLYAPAQRRWLCLPTGTADLGRTALTDEGTAAVVLDFEGRLLWIDLVAARGLLR